MTSVHSLVVDCGRDNLEREEKGKMSVRCRSSTGSDPFRGCGGGVLLCLLQRGTDLSASFDASVK